MGRKKAERREIGPFLVPRTEHLPTEEVRPFDSLAEEAYLAVRAKFVVHPGSKAAKNQEKKAAKNEAARLAARCPNCGSMPTEWHDYWKLGFTCNSAVCRLNCPDGFTWYPDPLVLNGYV